MNRWQLTPGHDLRLRFWGESCVLHHRASNETHRLAAGAGQLLEHLRDAGPQTSEQLAAQLDDLAPHEAEALLEQLRPLLLVERCP